MIVLYTVLFVVGSLLCILLGGLIATKILSSAIEYAVGKGLNL